MSSVKSRFGRVPSAFESLPNASHSENATLVAKLFTENQLAEMIAPAQSRRTLLYELESGYCIAGTNKLRSSQFKPRKVGQLIKVIAL